MTAEDLSDRHFILLRLEADEQLAAAKLQHRALDDRGLREHQLDRFRFGEGCLVGIGKLAERRAGLVQQRFPASLLRAAAWDAAL